MLTYPELQKNATRFLSMTGLTVPEFEALLPSFAEAWAADVARRASAKLRQRKVGGGRKAILHSTADKLLFILVYCKLYPLQEAQGAFFGLSQSQTNEWIHRLAPLLQAALGDPLSARGAEAFEKMWRERVSGDVILCGILTEKETNNSKNNNNNNRNKNNSQSKQFETAPPPASPIKRRFAHVPAFVENPGSAFVGIPDNILTAVERSGISAQFQTESTGAPSLRVPRDLNRIRIGLSAALRVSVGIPDDTLYDLLAVGKVGVFLLRQMRANLLQQQKNNNNNTGSDKAKDVKNNLSKPQSNNNNNNGADQIEITIAALLDVAKWIKYQLDSDKHPIDAAT